MKITAILTFAALFCCPVIALADSGKNVEGKRVRIVFNNEEAVVVMHDNPVSRDFLSLLPLTMTLKDYARTEKITDLPRKLSTEGGVHGEKVTGDFAYYAPWGNLAVFYKGYGHGSELYILGKIEKGKDALGRMDKEFSARIELMEE